MLSSFRTISALKRFRTDFVIARYTNNKLIPAEFNQIHDKKRFCYKPTQFFTASGD